MIKIITYAYMREETDISKVIEDSKLDNPIKNAQARLKALIGISFYDQLVSQATSLPVSLSTENLALFDPYVKQFIAWQAYQFYLVKANTFESRIGVRVFQEENSEPATDKIMGEQIALARENAQTYKNLMINFLNSAKRVSTSAYPLYTMTCKNITSSGFGISAISKIDKVNFKIENQILNNEP